MLKNHTKIIVLCFGLQIAWAAAGETVSLQTEQIRALGIESQVARSAAPNNGGRLPARVLLPNAQLRIVGAPVAGMISMLAVAPGATVRRGQVLAHLASPQGLELQRDALSASYQAKLQAQNLKRDEQLFAEGLIAESRLQTTRSASAQAGAQAEQSRQALDLAGIAIGKVGGPLALVAPMDGTVLEQNVQVGQRVDSASPIYRIGKLSPLWLEIQAPLALAATLREGMPVRLAGSPTVGRLIAIGNAVDPGSQTVLLRAEIGKGSEALRPGQVCDVEIEASAGKSQRIPSAAVTRVGGKTLVFVQTASNTRETQFAARPINIVSQGGDSVTVDGIGPDERLAVKGVSGLKALLTGVGSE